MKNNSIFTLFCIGLSLFLWMASTGGPANVQGSDLSGSPLSVGTCSSCHSGGNFSPAITAQLLDNGMPVSQYQPGKTYTLRVAISASNNPSRYGFQAVALMGERQNNAGTFGAAPTGFRKTTLQSREYIEHSSPRQGSVMEFSWTAPSDGAETVRFYAAGIAANNNGSSSGDSPAALTAPLSVSPLATSTNELVAEQIGLQLLGNPISETLRLNLNNPEAGRYRFTLFSSDGRHVWNTQQWLPAGKQALEWSLPNVSKGIYRLRIESPAGQTAVAVQKM